MDSSGLQPEQARLLASHVAKELRYLNKLCARMQRLGFPTDDPLVQAGTRARNAVQDLLGAARYAGMKQGVGRSADGDRMSP